MTQDRMTYQEWLASRPFPLAGRETGGGDGGAGDGGGAGDAGGDAGGDLGAGAGDAGGEHGDPVGTGAPAGDGGDDDDFVRLPKSEAEAMRKENAAFKRKMAEAEKAARRERETLAADQGRWEELAQEREQEVLEALDAKEAAEYELDRYRREVRTVGLATRLGFRDPRDAILHLSDDDTADEGTCERALRKLAKDKQYLVDPRRASGVASGGSGGAGALTMEQIKNMTPDEINSRWTEVQRAMAMSGGSVHNNG